jgi:hypothetical protein
MSKRPSIPVLFAVTLSSVLCFQSPALGQMYEDDEIFARGAVGGWTMEAATIQDPLNDPPPHIRSIECSARNADMLVVRRRDGSGTISLDDREGDGHSVLTIDRLKVGERQFNAQAMSIEFSRRYNNVEYPPESGIMLSSFHGYLGIEMRPGLWVPIDYMLRDFLSGVRIAIRHRDLNSERRIWRLIHTAGLASALAWCDRAISSPDALRFQKQGR